MVVEDLISGAQRHFIGHAEEISTITLQHDGLILASASGTSKTSNSQICIWNVPDGVCKKVRYITLFLVALSSPFLFYFGCKRTKDSRIR